MIWFHLQIFFLNLVLYDPLEDPAIIYKSDEVTFPPIEGVPVTSNISLCTSSRTLVVLSTFLKEVLVILHLLQAMHFSVCSLCLVVISPIFLMVWIVL